MNLIFHGLSVPGLYTQPSQEYSLPLNSSVPKTTQAILLFLRYCFRALWASMERYPVGVLWTLAVFLSVMVLLLTQEILSEGPFLNGSLKTFFAS